MISATFELGYQSEQFGVFDWMDRPGRLFLLLFYSLIVVICQRATVFVIIFLLLLQRTDSPHSPLKHKRLPLAFLHALRYVLGPISGYVLALPQVSCPLSMQAMQTGLSLPHFGEDRQLAKLFAVLWLVGLRDEFPEPIFLLLVKLKHRLLLILNGCSINSYHDSLEVNY